MLTWFFTIRINLLSVRYKKPAERHGLRAASAYDLRILPGVIIVVLPSQAPCRRSIPSRLAKPDRCVSPLHMVNLHLIFIRV